MNSWFQSDEEYFQKKDDNWIGYLNRTFIPHHDVPFADSSWSTTSHYDDEEIHRLVEDRLYACEEIDASLILVTVINGNVYLRGQVRTAPEIKQAEEEIRSLPEVWGVTNELSVISKT